MSSPNDTTGHADQTVIQPNGRPRPLSPHLQVWRWHVTMTASILFRVTIGAASAAAALMIGWLGVLAFGPDVYATVGGVLASPIGLAVAFGLLVVLFSLILNGSRHLINDTGQGLTLKPASLLSSLAVWGPVPLALLVFVVLFATGRISL